MKQNTHRIIPTDIDIITCTISGDCREGRHRGGEATEVDGDGRLWPAMTDPEGGGASRRKESSDVEVPHCRPIEMPGSLAALFDYRRSLSRMRVEGGDLHWGLRH